MRSSAVLHIIITFMLLLVIVVETKVVFATLGAFRLGGGGFFCIRLVGGGLVEVGFVHCRFFLEGFVERSLFSRSLGCRGPFRCGSRVSLGRLRC